MVGRPLNKDYADALFLGLPTYDGMPHKACGRTLRYTTNGSCIHCAKLASIEKRERQRYLRHQAKTITITLDELSEETVRAAFDVPEEINDPDPVDSEPEDGLDTDDPDARLQDIL